MATARITLDIEMLDGTTYEGVRTVLKDQVSYSTTRAKHGWPTMQDDPTLFINFIAYSALKREGKFSGTWDEFCETCAGVGDASGDDDVVDPS